MTTSAPTHPAITATGKPRAAYTMLGHFKTRSVAPNGGGVLDKWTWRGDTVIREYAKQNRFEKSEVLALLTKLLETYNRLTTIVIYDNRPEAVQSVLLKIVHGMIVINNLTGSEADRLAVIREKMNQ